MDVQKRIRKQVLNTVSLCPACGALECNCIEEYRICKAEADKNFIPRMERRRLGRKLGRFIEPRPVYTFDVFVKHKREILAREAEQKAVAEASVKDGVKDLNLPEGSPN